MGFTIVEVTIEFQSTLKSLNYFISKVTILSNTAIKTTAFSKIKKFPQEIFIGLFPAVLGLLGLTAFVYLAILTGFGALVVLGVIILVLVPYFLYGYSPKFNIKENESMQLLIGGAGLILGTLFVGLMIVTAIREIPKSINEWSSEKDAGRLSSLRECQRAPSCSLTSSELQELNKLSSAQ